MRRLIAWYLPDGDPGQQSVAQLLLYTGIHGDHSFGSAAALGVSACFGRMALVIEARKRPADLAPPEPRVTLKEVIGAYGELVIPNRESQ